MMDNSRDTTIGTNHEDIKKQQDEALKTPGYSDDPHIESSNRNPKDPVADGHPEEDRTGNGSEE